MTELAIAMHERGYLVKAAVFYRRGPLVAELERHGIEIIDLMKKGRWDVAGFAARTVSALRHAKPDVLYSFLGGANIVAAALRPFVRNIRLIWSIRSSNVDLGRYDWTHRLSYLLECRLSGVPDAIIANSVTGRDFAVGHGFPLSRIEVVPNGIDTDRFRPDGELRNRQRREWGLAEGEVAVGMLARLDPMKDHPTFLRAAALLETENSRYRFLCVGEGPERQRLIRLAAELGLQQRLAFVGESDPVPALNAFDVACSSSITEGFPNAIAEAMACGKACAVTAAGDSGLIVDGFGVVVPAGNAQALAGAILTAHKQASPARSAAARQRILDHYSKGAMVEGTCAIIERLLRGL